MLRVARTQACRIAGTAAVFPGAPWDNRAVVARFAATGRRGERTPEELDELAATMGETLGIARRHWAHVPDTGYDDREATTVDLGAEALEAALADAMMSPRDLGAIVTATSTPARATGANAPAIADRLGARCAAFDVRSGCSGGLLALVQACTLAASSGQPVAVVAADTFSKLVPPRDALAALAFGDGAGAAIVVPAGEGERGLRSAAFASDGSLGHLAAAPLPFPVTTEHLERGLGYLQGDAEALAARAPGLCAQTIEVALSLASIASTDVDVFVPHQTSAPAIAALADKARIPIERAVVTVQDHGNCGAGGVLIALDAARREGRLRDGAKMLLAAFGGGLAWGAAVMEC